MNDDNTQDVAMPYFKTLPRDEIADSRIQLLDLHEFGAYVRLKYQIWIDGSLPFDEKFLAKLLRISEKKFKKIWENISPLFLNDGKLSIADFQSQRANYNDYIEQRRIAGQKSAEKRANDRSTTVQRPFNDTKAEAKAKAESEVTTQTNAPASQRAETVCMLDSSKSDFSMDKIREYVLACQNAGQKIINPVGLATHLYQTGNADKEIADFFQNGKVPVSKKPKSTAERRREAVEAAKAMLKEEVH